MTYGAMAAPDSNPRANTALAAGCEPCYGWGSVMGVDLLRVPRWGDLQRFGMWPVVPTSTVAGVEPAVRRAGAERGWVWCAVVDGGIGGQAS